MKQKIKSTAIILTFLLSWNFTNAQVKTDYDKTIDFTKYKTYSFKGWEKKAISS